MQPPEVHDALDPRGGSGSRDVARGAEFGALEVALGAHGVHQVVEHVDILDRGGDGCRIREVALDDLDVGGPRGVAQLERIDRCRLCRELFEVAVVWIGVGVWRLVCEEFVDWRGLSACGVENVDVAEKEGES